MDQVISDAEISSCQEMEEMRQAAERAAIEELERRMNDIIRETMEEDQEVIGEKNVFEMELENEVRSVNTLRDMLGCFHEALRQQLQDMLDLQTELTNVNLDTVRLLTSLQDLREQNHAILRADPIYNLVQEERHLQQQLDKMGIYVYPPTGSDEHYQS